MNTVTVNSYFSGAGLLDCGLLLAGLALRQSFEVEPICCETQRRNYRHEVVQCDISEKLVLDDNPCDVMVATYPCTRYSTGADIHGTRTGDSLFLHFFRHIAIRRPEVYVVENVPGMRQFPVVMEAMSRLPDYYVQVFCPVNASIWLPQNRKRLILIGSRKPFGWRPPQNSRPVRLREIIEADPDVTIPPSVYARLEGAYRDKPIISDPARDDIAPTCVAHYAKDRSTRLVADHRYPHGCRPYSVREYARLQGVPDWFDFAGSESQQYRMIGNGVPVPLGEWVGRELRRYMGMRAAA